MKPALLACTLLIGLSGCASVMGDVRPFAPVPVAMPSPAISAQIAAAQMAAAQPAAAQPAALAYAAPTGAAPVSATPAPSAVNAGGSIFASAGGVNGNRGLRLFQDIKAREVGDLLTIVLIENTRAKTNAKTAVTKDAGIGMGAPSIFGQSVTYKGKSILQAEVEGTRKFGGAGDSAQSNQLDGDITVTVIEQLGNGNLRVAGEKRVRLNQGDELVQVQGIVRTADIGPDNRITSDRIGEAQIVYGGRGTLARSNAMGWLGRFFNSAAFPY